MLNLGQARQVLAKYCGSAQSPDDPRVIDDINLAIERLMNKPKNWTGLIAPLILCAPNGQITLPREVAKIVKARINGRFAQPQSQWYEYLSNGPGLLEQQWTGCMDPLIDRGFACTQYDMPIDSPMYISVVSDRREDAGAKMLIRGLDDTGREVHGDTLFGELVRIGAPDEMWLTENLFSTISTIQKPVTKGYLYVSAMLPKEGIRYFLGSLHPDETIPHYRRYFAHEVKIEKCRGVNGVFCPPSPVRIDALCRLQYVPAVHDSDLLLIQNQGALKMMLKAVRFEDAEDLDNAVKWEASAERLMNEMTQTMDNEDYMVEVDESLHGGQIESV